CRSLPSRIAYCWSVTRSSRYRSWETTMSVPGQESSKSSIAVSISESTSFVGSSSTMTLGSLSSNNNSCKRRFCPPERSSTRAEEHTSELQSRFDLVCRLLLEKKK